MTCLSKNVEDDQNLYCSKNWIHHFNVFSWEPPKPPPPAVPPAQALLRLRIIVDEGKIQEVHQPVATKSCCFLRQFKTMWFHLWFYHVSFPTKQWSNGKPGVFYVREMGWVKFLWICVRTHENQFDGRTKDLWFSYHYDISASFDVLDYWLLAHYGTLIVTISPWHHLQFDTVSRTVDFRDLTLRHTHPGGPQTAYKDDDSIDAGSHSITVFHTWLASGYLT